MFGYRSASGMFHLRCAIATAVQFLHGGSRRVQGLRQILTAVPLWPPVQRGVALVIWPTGVQHEAEMQVPEYVRADHRYDCSIEDSCANTWYGIPEQLSEHYRNHCRNNVFKCPLHGCEHVARVETIADHYEMVHGPFDTLTPDNQDQQTYTVTFKICLR